KPMEEDVDDYLNKRERNNVSVKKSRQKSRSRAREMKDRVENLRMENADLENKVALLSKELGILKELFISHA
ncbi:CCAAT/enhancer-binding protein gamma, partial [Lamellibrachia satsuma]